MFAGINTCVYILTWGIVLVLVDLHVCYGMVIDYLPLSLPFCCGQPNLLTERQATF